MKLYAILAGLALGSSLGPLSAATPGAAPPQVITAADARIHVGQTVAIESIVGEVHRAASSGAVFLDMAGHYPNNAFAAVVFKGNLAKFSNLEALKGKTVRVTGTVKLYRGMPEIVLSDPAQLKVKGGA
jgi:DNA/RNA endonuclease YhcR with UshA esterase domain